MPYPPQGGFPCCCPDCIQAEDTFDCYSGAIDQNGVTCQEHFPVGDGLMPAGSHTPAWEYGDTWTWGRSPYPQYEGDGALFELSGSGAAYFKIGWGNESANGNNSRGAGLQIQTVAEMPFQVYVLYLMYDEDTGNQFQLEYNIGNTNPAYGPIVAGGLTLKVNGVTIKSGGSGGWDANCDPLVNFWCGKLLWARWHADYQVFCAGYSTPITNENQNASLCVTPTEFAAKGITTFPAGKKFGIGNASGNGIPICIDNFQIYRAQRNSYDENSRTIGNPSCFGCMCRCKNSIAVDPDQIPHLFPKTITARIWAVTSELVACPGSPPPTTNLDHTFQLIMDPDTLCNRPYWRTDPEIMDMPYPNPGGSPPIPPYLAKINVRCNVNLPVDVIAPHIEFLSGSGIYDYYAGNGMGFDMVKSDPIEPEGVPGDFRCSPFRLRFTITVRTSTEASSWPGTTIGECAYAGSKFHLDLSG
jgi:hypothetical protein